MIRFGHQAADHFEGKVQNKAETGESISNIFEVCLDPANYKSKQEAGNDIAKISNRISSFVKNVSSKDIKSFAEDVGANGQAFCPATFNGSRKKENFTQSQLLVLDFDNDKPTKTITWQQAKERADKYHLPILFAYDNLSSNADKQKFRATFLNDASVTDTRGAEIMQQALMTIFPEVDQTSKDISKIYFGGKNLLYVDEKATAVNIEEIVRNMTIYLRDEYGDTNYKRKIKEFAETTGVALNENGFLDITVVDDEGDITTGACSEFNKNSPNEVIIKAFGENLLNRYYRINLVGGSSCTSSPSASRKTFKNHKMYRSGDIKLIRPACQLFRDFEDGTYKLEHRELFMLATNLINIESGRKLFLDTLRNHSHIESYVQKYNYWAYNLGYMVQNRYKPKSCDGDCRHNNQCNHGKNIITTAMSKGIESIPNHQEKLYSLEESTADVKEKIEQAVSDKSIGVNVFNAPTATGKTEITLNIMAHSVGNILVAVSNNDLKNDFYKRAIEKSINNVMKTPSLHEIQDDIPAKIWRHIQKLYRKGKSHAVIPYIRTVLAKENEEDISCLEKYLEDLKEFEEFDGHVITTHKRLRHMSDEMLEKYDTVIIDEDFILNCFIPDKNDIPISDLKNLKKRLPNKSKLYKKICKLLNKIQTQTFFTLSKVDYYEQDDEDDTDDNYVLDDISTPIDISSFCEATHFCYRKASDEENLSEDCISFFKPLKLSSSVKYIMLSATADESICRYFFENYLGLPFKYDYCKRSPYMGKVYQYSDKSYSRTCLGRVRDTIPRIKKWTGFDHTITFKTYAKGASVYFGKANGVDYMKGQNIDIIGTNHQPEFLYKLFAYTLRLDFDITAALKPKSKSNTFEHNGYRFPLTSYDDEVLRSIQFWMISSELEQAVGRARLLRCDCTVNVFSDFPVSQAILREPEYESVEI